MLRVGILPDSNISSVWEAKVIEDIQSSGFARVELVIFNNPSAQNVPLAEKRHRNPWRSKLFHFYERWDYRRNRDDRDALALTDLSSRLDGLPSISVSPSREDLARNISDDQLTEIRNRSLDVIFHFGVNTLPDGMVSIAKYGVWTFHHGNTEDRSGPLLFRELMDREPVSESTLRILTDISDGRRVIYQGYSSTDQLSLYSSRNPTFWKTSEFGLRCLRKLDERGIEYIHSLPLYREKKTDTHRKNRTPSNFQMLLFVRRYIYRWLQARVAHLRPGSRTKWYIALRKKDAIHRFDNSSNYRRMYCPKDRFYADPFLVEKDGKTYLFFEDFRYPEGRAVISCCELAADGTPGLPIEVLRCPYHLSYPFVFEHEGEMYMIPETRGNRMVELYRATSFPTTWASEAVLLSDIHAVDATVQKINGKFWMFAGVSNGNYSNSDELCLFFADALKGPWTPHSDNPVLSDVQRARPAGKLFYDEGRLIRPSQDCGKAYGYALVFSEVLTLNETKYEERLISRLNPESVPGCVGTHTYNRTERFEVVDRTLPAKPGNMTGN